MTTTFSRVDDGKTDHDFQAILNFTASPDDVYEAVISPAAITVWWVPTSGIGTAGGDLVFRFGDMKADMHVEEAERPSRVRWNVLTCEPIPDWAGTYITFDIAPAGDGGTRLVFRHYGLTPQLECFDMCQNGWTEHLSHLVDHVETGG